MNPAELFVQELYQTFEGRVPFTAGFDANFKKVLPVVYEDQNEIPIGLVAAASTQDDPSIVQLYHVSSFKVGKGHGAQIMRYLCELADKHKASIYLQAEAQFTDKDTPVGPDLVSWYTQFGFAGVGIMLRKPNA